MRFLSSSPWTSGNCYVMYLLKYEIQYCPLAMEASQLRLGVENPIAIHFFLLFIIFVRPNGPKIIVVFITLLYLIRSKLPTLAKWHKFDYQRLTYHRWKNTTDRQLTTTKTSLIGRIKQFPANWSKGVVNWQTFHISFATEAIMLAIVQIN